MNPLDIVSILLEDDLPGVDQQTLDEIMGIIIRAVDKVKSGNPNVDRPRFEQEVNPLLSRWGIEFRSNDKILMKYGPPGRAGMEGVIIATPKRINRDEFSNMRELLSHELVHGDQISRAFTGNAAKMVSSATQRMMPGGQLDYAKYHTDPHEVTAYARSAVDSMRRGRLNRADALTAIKRGHTNRLLKGMDPKNKSYKRFLKHAAGYSQQLPEE